MHDGISLEKRGVPTVVIVSEPFIGNANTMARLLGMPDYRYVALPHPISSLDRKGIDELVRRHFPQVLELLLARPKT